MNLEKELGKFAESYSKIAAAQNKEDEKREWLEFIQKIKEDTLDEVKSVLDDYFKNLVLIPHPEITKENIKDNINKLYGKKLN